MQRKLLLVGVASALLVPAAWGGTLGDQVEQECAFLTIPEAACGGADAALEGLERPGVSYGNFQADGEASVEVANFYFAPRVIAIRDGERITWENVNGPGGNRHSVVSSDWNGNAPVVPAPPFDFGGGKGFKSSALQPQNTFSVVMDLASLAPEAQVDLHNGYVLVTYHCYIHGAGQMNGQILVKRAA